jgi:response regulator of citrate/malate metabolism
MERTRNTNNGRFNNAHAPEDILRVMERGEIYSTGTLADKTSIARRTALKYLNELAEQGRIEKEMPNANTAVWIRRE